MRALSNISLPRIAQGTEYNKLQAERSNETRLNQNFRIIQGSIAEMEIIENSMDKRIESLENPAFSPGISSVSDSTDWRVVTLNTNDVFAAERSNAITLAVTTAAGSLYKGETTVTPPSVFSEITSVQVTIESASDCLFALVKDFSTSGINVRVLATASGSYSFRLHIFITGKVTA